MRYALHKLRCSACGQIFTAPLPRPAGEEQYSTRARAVLAVSRYDLGVPGYRLQGYQAMLGVPVPDATQWDQIEQVGDCAYGVLAQMEKEAAQGALILQDDTAVRLLSLIKENLEMLSAAQAQGLSTSKERTGMPTTALVVQVGEHIAILDYSSRRHAGENLQGLLDKREAGLVKPLVMSDALASNEVANDAAVIRCHCLAHGRRKFSDLAAVFPHECQVVLEVISQVFDHDEQARKEQLSPAARSFATTVASVAGVHPTSAAEPPVVCSPATSKWSFTSTGMPCSGPDKCPHAWNCASSASAVASASGLVRITAPSAGPRRSYAAIRLREVCVIARAVVLPAR